MREALALAVAVPPAQPNQQATDARARANDPAAEEISSFLEGGLGQEADLAALMEAASDYLGRDATASDLAFETGTGAKLTFGEAFGPLSGVELRAETESEVAHEAAALLRSTLDFQRLCSTLDLGAAP